MERRDDDFEGSGYNRGCVIPSPLVLVVDDDRQVAEEHARILRRIGFTPRTECDPEQVESALQREPGVELVLLDLRMPGLNGLELLQRIKLRRPDVGVVMATVINDVEHAVRAIKAGAYNYLLKPLQAEQVQRVLESYYSNRPAPLNEDPRFRPFITGHPAFREIFRRVQIFAETTLPVLLLGETGTGKELIANLIHALSPRAGGSFLTVNVAAIPPTLFESEMFGHAKGAFTGALGDHAGYFEAAADGTLFLDEIGELGRDQQSRLLRVLQEKRYARVGETVERQSTARVVLATNRDLAADVAQARFREDLYYRISNYSITLPPLRDRGNDVVVLAEYFARKYASQFGRPLTGFSQEALQDLKAYSFPGNIRELEGIVNAAVLLEGGETIRRSSLPERLTAVEPPESELEKVRCRTVQRVLAECEGNQTKASEKLGIARQTLNGLLKTYRERGWIRS
ncbi:MAG TPA: sigma-54 dependent transcriptional regulator [Planctomycetota bacterium]|nr:sigma-54 dependent transcriptional regulator [Planctomycetota bacterium]